MTEDILKASIRGERLAQKEFYNFFKGKMFVVCLRYAKNREDAEDMLQEGFIKVFQDLHQYAGAGSLEGWVRKVIVNVALQHLKKQQRLLPTVEFDNLEISDNTDQELPHLDEPIAKNLIHILHQMPDGFRTVFNLYVMEGYTHIEIAEILGISVSTSKTQYLRAKAYMRKMLAKSLTT
ncbi:MAG: RNA polymerase sigma factor [Saprospiraceae bacterium]|nr:RNA polymerase sigma factor [Saprospiraceae bacterium]